MSKRFTTDDGLEDVLCWEINDKENEDMTCGECAKLLNELHSRNKRLEYKIQRERNSIHKQYAKWEKEAETKIKELSEENDQLKNRINDWRQRTFKAHEYFNLLEKVIDEVCDDDISNQIWKEYEKRERLIE